MEIVYSAANNSFFAKNDVEKYEEAGWELADVVDVTYDAYLEFIEDRTLQGQVRIAGADGFPAWGDIPPPTREELITAAEQVRQQLLAQADATMLDWRTELMLGEISDASREKLSAWLAYKNAVKSVDVTTDPEHVNWPVPPGAQA
ncbi:tail fiber assembly protein [Escherichia coli]|uniref:tail fiber assembly protein n=1 Tax=Escherichia coli TaxID=562 RepID=UPI001FFFB0E2|nr:tail fiber assembly protein [Escherichia coli]MCK3430741.1 tail fiber assembly protein [Escherichia coli]